MGSVGTLLQAVALWLCLCAGRAFVQLPAAAPGRGPSASSRLSARSHQPLHGALSACLEVFIVARNVFRTCRKGLRLLVLLLAHET